ncbi:Nuclease SbcCD subunit D [Halomicronema hongdechloris C2206]|uniref:Nuclease SbcCD subunit D n=1 Tax=Halomicronema hongdechloris C2206 TaxID=1641165 RepID=A0A1Z3HG57_9CYAN|nr:exonuclease SbcCD subunit D [Halomicronema hongdechloris]ASC69246.1 Nuclease SbcCD subunit D [Halomicronema hongdechloris C2206]
MAITLLHLSDIHMGSGSSHGRVNPVTGLNSRLEDFTQTLARCIDRAVEESVDLVLFSGDAFPDATPPPVVQQAFAKQFRRLVDAQIPTVLLVGNHDQHSQGQGGASLCIYRTLGVPGFIVGDRLDTHAIETHQGPVQVVTLPWLTRSALLTRPEMEGLSMAEVHRQLIERLRVALEGEVRRLDPKVPSILLAHAMVDTAQYGAERFLAAGRSFTIPMGLLARPCFDYIALGHVHKHQILSQQPLMLYPGSIERVDFSEEQEEKGYVLVSLEKGQAQAQFCPLPVRPFRTLKIDVSDSDNPQADLLEAIVVADLEQAIVRLNVRLRPDQLDQLDTNALEQALHHAHSYSLNPLLVSQLSRPRLPELAADDQREPIAALKAYVAHQQDLSEIADDMIEAAQALLAGEVIPRPTTDRSMAEEPGAEDPPEPSRQLRLL